MAEYRHYPSTPEFEAWWAAYPNKKSKGDAKKAWAQTASGRPPLPELLKALATASASDRWRRDDGEYIPYPATWLRGERWDDMPVERPQAAPGPWWGSVSGIDAKAAEFELAWDKEKGETYQQFAKRVRAAATKLKAVG